MSPFGLVFFFFVVHVPLPSDISSFHRDCYENREENNSRAFGPQKPEDTWALRHPEEPSGRVRETERRKPRCSSTAESQGRRPSLRETPTTESLLNWRITALRYCVGFAIQCESAASTHTCPLLLATASSPSHPSRLSRSPGRVPCAHTVAPQLTLLDVAVYICQCHCLNLPLPLPSPCCVQSLFSRSAPSSHALQMGFFRTICLFLYMYVLIYKHCFFF